jgi:hypothetical protein
MHDVALWTTLVLIVTGCSKQSEPGQPAAATQQSQSATVPANEPQTTEAKADGPAAAVAEFLEAIRTGNDEVASKMLSTVARKKTAALNRSVTPPASDTAKFTVGKVKQVAPDIAHVACTWTDLDPDRQPKTDEAIWVVRHEQSGWRVAGVAAQVFPGEQPVLLNFEDPEDMLRQQQWVREEMRRRMEKEESGLQAQGGENPDKSIRR